MTQYHSDHRTPFDLGSIIGDKSKDSCYVKICKDRVYVKDMETHEVISVIPRN